MSATYYFTLTDYGSSLIANAHNIQTIQLIDLHLGDANGLPYSPISKKNRTNLVNKRASVPIQSIEIIGNIARITATIESHIGGFNVHELGLTDATGQLVYIGNYHGGYKPVLSDGAGGELALVIDIQAEAGSNVLITVSPNNVTANKDWVLATLTESIKQAFLHIYHVGSWHGSNNYNYHPATALKLFFGYETTWVLWPYVPKGVASMGDAIGAISGINTGASFQAASTRIWQRLEDGATGPTYQLSTNKTVVDEGGQITFTLQTTGLATGTPVDWSITGIQSDDISPSIMNGQFIIDATGKAFQTFNIIADNKTEGNQTLAFALTFIQGQQVSVMIMDTSKYPEGQQTYYEGTHTLSVAANQTMSIDMFAAGGGGGGSVYSGGTHEDHGTNGANIILSYLTNTLITGGGKAGTGGVWGNGSSYTNGKAGIGGVNTLNADESFIILENTAGNTAVIGSRWNRQEGAVALPSSIGMLNNGGAGAWGIGDEKWSYGGGGGSGARLKVQFTNSSEEAIDLNLVIGGRGLGWKNSGNYGDDSGIGFALVTTT